MNHALWTIAVALSYLAVAGVSAWLAADDVAIAWLASGFTLGLLVGREPRSWWATLAGAGLGSAAFALLMDSPPAEAGAYALIEIVSASLAAGLVMGLVSVPIRLDDPPELAALLLGGVVAMSVASGIMAAAWQVATGGADALDTFRAWMLSNVVGTLLVAPAVVAWLRVDAPRPDAWPLRRYLGGAIACSLFLGGLFAVFADVPAQRRDDALAYLPLLFLALVALLWEVRGTTLAALAGALLAIALTERGMGPFAGVDVWLGDPVLAAQLYSAALSLSALIIGVTVCAHRETLREASEWQERFAAIMGAHDVLGYEWDPPSNRFLTVGDAMRFMDVHPEALVTLDHWLQRVPAQWRDDIGARFAARASGEGAVDVLNYPLAGVDGRLHHVSDEARAIRDRNGDYRIVGIVRRHSGRK